MKAWCFAVGFVFWLASAACDVGPDVSCANCLTNLTEESCAKFAQKHVCTSHKWVRLEDNQCAPNQPPRVYGGCEFNGCQTRPNCVN